MHRALLRLLAICLTCAVLPAAAQAACDGQDLTPTLDAQERAALQTALDGWPYPQGNHWRATRDGTVVHLIGTIHVGDPRLGAPVAGLVPVVQSADLLLLEMTAADRTALMAEMARDPHLLMQPGPTLPERLPEAEWQALAAATQARGLPGVVAARMRPWYLSTLLALPACLDLRGAAQGGVDAALEAAAEAAGVPTAALEDPRDLFNAFDGISPEAELAMLRATLAAPDMAEDQFETLMANYLREDHGTAWALSQVLADRLPGAAAQDLAPAFRVLEDRFLAQRNRDWIGVIEAATKDRAGPVVAAFGAAHLGGPDGVLTLLEADGWALSRQPF